MFTGALTAIVTPMRDGKVDTKALTEFVEFQIAEGIDGLVPCGTTGEAVTLSIAEQSHVIRTVVEQTNKRVPVVAGAGANDTSKAIELSRMGAEAGADGLLHVTPYYNKPSAAGLVAHFRAVTEAVDRPVIAYNVPGRTGLDMKPEVVAEIAKLPRVVGVKEATGSVARGQAVIAACYEGFEVLSGDDATSFALTAMGGVGVISVASNVVPGPFAKMIAHARASELEAGRAINYRLLPLMDALFVESNPIPIKAAVARLGFGNNELRLPLVALAGDKLDRVDAELKRLGLLS